MHRYKSIYRLNIVDATIRRDILNCKVQKFSSQQCVRKMKKKTKSRIEEKALPHLLTGVTKLFCLIKGHQRWSPGNTWLVVRMVWLTSILTC